LEISDRVGVAISLRLCLIYGFLAEKGPAQYAVRIAEAAHGALADDDSGRYYDGHLSEVERVIRKAAARWVAIVGRGQYAEQLRKIFIDSIPPIMQHFCLETAYCPPPTAYYFYD